VTTNTWTTRPVLWRTCSVLDDVPWPLNVGTGLGHTVKEVADIITGVTTLPIDIEPLQERMFDVTDKVLDCSALVGLVDLASSPPISSRAGGRTRVPAAVRF